MMLRMKTTSTAAKLHFRMRDRVLGLQHAQPESVVRELCMLFARRPLHQCRGSFAAGLRVL